LRGNSQANHTWQRAWMLREEGCGDPRGSSFLPGKSGLGIDEQRVHELKIQRGFIPNMAEVEPRPAKDGFREIVGRQEKRKVEKKGLTRAHDTDYIGVRVLLRRGERNNLGLSERCPEEMRGFPGSSIRHGNAFWDASNKKKKKESPAPNPDSGRKNRQGSRQNVWKGDRLQVSQVKEPRQRWEETGAGKSKLGWGSRASSRSPRKPPGPGDTGDDRLHGGKESRF